MDAVDLRAGDMLVLVNGEYVVIEKIQHEITEEPVTVYNFQVADFHTYYVGDQSVLVHNAEYSPNPNGRKGCEQHQEVITEVENDILSRDLNPKREQKFDTTGGYKDTRYADIVALDSEVNIVEIHQVGKTLKDNSSPVSRERKAIADIESVSDGIQVQYHPYDSK